MRQVSLRFVVSGVTLILGACAESPIGDRTARDASSEPVWASEDAGGAGLLEGQPGQAALDAAVFEPVFEPVAPAEAGLGESLVQRAGSSGAAADASLPVVPVVVDASLVVSDAAGQVPVNQAPVTTPPATSAPPVVSAPPAAEPPAAAPPAVQPPVEEPAVIEPPAEEPPALADASVATEPPATDPPSTAEPPASADPPPEDPPDAAVPVDAEAPAPAQPPPLVCQEPERLCDDRCSDLRSDALNCGACTHRCAAGERCFESGCWPTPPAGCSLEASAGRAYLFCTDTRDWVAARQACLDFRMDLVIVDGDAENDFVRGHGERWAGASDRDGEGTWRTPVFGNAQRTNGAVLGYRLWSIGEPNNATRCEGNEFLGRCLGTLRDEDCLMIGADGRWNDSDCTQRKRYACEQQ